MTIEEALSVPGSHKDATLHVGGHGEPWYETKAIVVTHPDGKTWLCVRQGSHERVNLVPDLAQALKIFSQYVASARRDVLSHMPVT